MNKNNDKNIKEVLSNNTILTESEVELIYNKIENQNNLSSKDIVQYLLKKDLIYRYNDSVKPYKDRKKISISINKNLEQLFNNYPNIIISVWDTSLFLNLTNMQLMKTLYFVETYSFMQDIVLKILLNNNYPVVLEKDYDVVYKYYLTDEIYIIKTINEDSPIVKKKNITNVTVPKIEKVLVDIFNDDILNSIYSSELNTIYKEILSKYAINIKTMFRYAKKKYVLEQLKSFLKEIDFDIELGEFK